MGCANSRHHRCRHCGLDPYSPKPRGYSTPAGHRQLRKKDRYHVVALTSSSGSLKLEISNQDSSAAMDQKDDDPRIRNGCEKSKCDCTSVAEDKGVRKRNELQLELIEAKTWSKMIDKKVSKGAPKTPIITPPGEPEAIDTWELMEGLEDTASPFLSRRQSKSLSFSAARGSSNSPNIPTSRSHQPKGMELKRQLWLQFAEDDTDSKTSTVTSDFDPDITSTFRKSLEVLPQDNSYHLELSENKLNITKHGNETSEDEIKSEELDNFSTDYKMCESASKDKVVFYFTSLRGIRKTYEDCCNARIILKSIGVVLDERDVSLHSGFKEELKELLQDKSVKSGLPRVFIGTTYIGGAEEIAQLHEEGQLEKLLEGCPKVADSGTCEACGDIRFVPCETCSGSCKIYYERDYYEDEEEEEEEHGSEDDDEYGFQRCPDCNENGLIRCPFCWN